MQPDFQPSKLSIWIGRLLGAVIVLFLAVDAGMKLAKASVVLETMAQLGYPESSIVGIGLLLLACTTLYVIPRTTPLGAILLTGYLGGAISTNVRAQTPLFNIVFPVMFGAGLWASLLLRDKRVRQALFHRA